MPKKRAFMEVLAISLSEDCRFPVLEVFTFLYVIATIFFSNMSLTSYSFMTLQYIKSEEALAFSLVEGLTGFPIFMLLLLIIKNIAFGLGNDLEKGTMQTFLSYPLGRKMLLTARLISSVGVEILLFLGIQVFVLYIIAPYSVSTYLITVILTYVAALCFPLFITGLALLLSLILKKGSWALIVGILMQFVMQILATTATYLSTAAGSDIIIKIFSVINPIIALERYYRSNPQHFVQAEFFGRNVWSPSFNEALSFIGAGCVLVIVIFLVAYFYFEKRLEI
jgi:ABC-type transport system involved in multi-copper enzyme maturation permease subunit